LAGGDEPGDPCGTQLVVELAGREAPVERDEHGAEAQAGQQRFDQGRVVGSEVGDAVASADSRCAQLGGAVEGPGVDLRICQLLSVEDDRRLLTVVAGLLFGQTGQARMFHRGTHAWGSFVVAVAEVGSAVDSVAERLRDFVSPRRTTQKTLMRAKTARTIDRGTVEAPSLALMIAAKRTGEMPAPIPAIW